MHKVYLRDFYPPIDIVIYLLVMGSFTGIGLFYLNEGRTIGLIPYFLVSAIAFLKLLSALSVTKLFTTFISAGQKGILIRSYFSPSRSFNWKDIRKLEVKHDRLVVQQNHKNKNKVYYFSSFSDNEQQLTKLLKTIAPPEHREKIA